MTRRRQAKSLFFFRTDQEGSDAYAELDQRRFDEWMHADRRMGEIMFFWRTGQR